MPLERQIPVPEEPNPENEPEDKRLWVGNLDIRVTEYQLLKIFQKFGTIEKFDLLFHKTGPLAGQPKGYAFVTFSNTSDAVEMMTAVNGKLLGSKNVVVKWAHAVVKTEKEKPKVDLNIPALVGANTNKKVNIQSQIWAIEQKLKMMEKSSVDDISFSNQPSTSCRPKDDQHFRNKHFRTNRFGPYKK